MFAEKFVHFDWGTEENIARYGQATPPEYDLGYVTCPVSLFWSDNDLLADPEVSSRRSTTALCRHWPQGAPPSAIYRLSQRPYTQDL